MATTAGGLPYPVGTDRVVDGDNAIRALAEALDPRVTDTGWIAVTAFQNGFSGVGGSVYYRYRNGMVALSGQLYRSTAPTSLTAAFVIPQQYAPRSTYDTVLFLDWGLVGQVAIGGTVSIQSSTARASSTGYMLDAMIWMRA